MTPFRITLLFLLLLTVVLINCGKKSADEDGSGRNAREWKEMDEFHMVMAEAFHPYKDSSDLKPARELSGELLAAASRWKNAPLPEKVDNDRTKQKLEELAKLAARFDDEVKSDNPVVIGQTLTDLHDLFHDLQNEWYGADNEVDHHEH
jgi:hypothetical protein